MFLKRNTYVDLVHNLADAVKAWKVVTILLAALTVCAILGMAWLATHQTVVLVPQDVAFAPKKITVQTTAGFTDSYLGYLAQADVALALDWTPDDVSAQYTRFLDRTTPEFYASQQVGMLASALDHAKAAEVQSFYPSKTKLVGKNAVSVQGTLVRWIGDKQVFHQPVVYTVTYVPGPGGLPYVSSLNTDR